MSSVSLNEQQIFNNKLDYFCFLQHFNFEEYLPQLDLVDSFLMLQNLIIFYKN